MWYKGYVIFFYLENNYSTMLWWSLPYTKKNQSYKFFTTSATWEAYIHTHTHTHTHTYIHTHTHTLILHFELPSTHLFHPCRSSQSIMLGFLCYTAKNAEFLKGKKKSPNLENHFPWHCLWKDPRMNYKYTLYHVSMPDLMVNYILQCLKLARKVNGPMNIQPD